MSVTISAADINKLRKQTGAVFKNENENVVKEVVEHTGLKLVEQHLINGMDRKADSMFVAILERC